MSRPTIKAQAETFQTYCEAVGGILEQFGGSAEKTLNLIAEEGIWLATGFNIFLIMGHVGPDRPIEYAQRQILVAELRALSGAVDAITDLKDMEITIPDLRDPFNFPPIVFKPFDDLVSWFLPPFVGQSGDILTPTQPLQMIYGFIQPVVEVASIQDDGGKYLALPFHYRVIMSLVIPGIIRSLVDILAQRSTLTLG